METILPQKKEFLVEIAAGKILPVSAELGDSSLSPLDVFTALRTTGPAVLLESARINEKTGRYSFVAMDPYLIFRSKGDSVSLAHPSRSSQRFGRRVSVKRDPLLKLRELMSNYRTEKINGLPPFTGGAVGFFSYEFVHRFEQLPQTVLDDLHVPDAYFLFVDSVIAFDHVLNRAWVIVNPGAREQELGFRRPAAEEWPKLYDEAVEKISSIKNDIRKKIASAGNSGRKETIRTHRRRALKPDLTKTRFLSMVEKCKEYIAAGDIYQANLSRRLSVNIGDADPFRLYTVLRKINPSPFAAFLDFGDLQIVGSSPERLISLRNGIAETRPIAGTREQGKDQGEKQALSHELLTNEKERAEHVMLLDLERNDLGRVCRYGTVAIDEMMEIENYSHVIHIVSNVKGELKPDHDCFDLLRAVFPGGTITGVPKVRCMEIIDELEPVVRGPYTGSAGYISNAGDMDMNIIIRSFIVQKGRAHIQVGAGIVADSDPDREYQETVRKAEALKKAVEEL